MSTIVEARGLKMYFPSAARSAASPKRLLKAVDDVSFSIQKGETFGLVGESGCGKRRSAAVLFACDEPTDGRIFFDGQDIAHLGEKPLTPYRRRMQMIFQDPYASLNPRMTVASIIAEPLRYAGASKAYQTERVRELVDLVGLSRITSSAIRMSFPAASASASASPAPSPATRSSSSATSRSPRWTSPFRLRSSTRWNRFRRSWGFRICSSPHDLSMVRHISHNVGVMYLGCMVERAPVHELYSNMLHPYTQALMSAVPIPDPDIAAASSRIHLSGDVPTPD